MRDRSIGKWRAARAFTVLIFVAAVGAATGICGRAAADSCAAVELVVARGTTEPGWLGAEVGDPLYAALRQELPTDTTAYPVRYPADLLDSSSVQDGTRDMVAHLVGQAAMCPRQRFVLAGYSQGAVVTHGVLGTGVIAQLPAIAALPAALAPRIAAVLLFGDPMRAIAQDLPQLYRQRTADYCAGGDPVCGGGLYPTSHTDYGEFIWAAAGFAASRI
ncbi:cutinase family protein [Nocardia panacis]|uniref:Cutinase family protein n=1 Tax=Nocardia panacis TaxID=2340916 RepID=A0A3A4KH59_9NOCA|nr:cutinase family protein [Nocardia panacis]RJO73809.1 cutinase family protein [Nocardia panacis]